MLFPGAFLLLALGTASRAQTPPPAESIRQWCRLALAGDPAAWSQEPSPPPERAKERLEEARRRCAGAAPETAQHEHHHQHEHEHNHEMTGALGPVPAAQEGSGTSWQPADSSSHKEGLHGRKGPWSAMAHGNASLAATRQGGPRGGEKLFSTSMLMGSLRRQIGAGQFQVRAMGSLEPAMGPQGYPLLLQTGETADGRTLLRDRQHPHDLFMELSASYSLPVGAKGSLFAYAGIPGEPALGPGVFMHRESGVDNPQAPITHHYMDSTHITYGVASVGATAGPFKVDASAFNGREPDERRWDIERPKLDSYSYRLTWNPTPKASFQASRGHLKSPEGLHPEEDAVRTTASASLSHPLKGNPWQTTVAWGRNTHGGGRALDGVLAESALRLGANTLFGRFELAEKDDLSPHQHDGHEGGASPATVGSLTAGMVRDVLKAGPMRLGVGGLVSRAFIPASLKPLYGNAPLSAMAWLRVKLSRD